MSDVLALGNQEQPAPEPMPERVLMRSPEGRPVQVMVDDIASFAEQGYVLEREPHAEAPAPKPRRTKPAEGEAH